VKRLREWGRARVGARARARARAREKQIKKETSEADREREREGGRKSEQPSERVSEKGQYAVNSGHLRPKCHIKDTQLRPNCHTKVNNKPRSLSRTYTTAFSLCTLARSFSLLT
jgi:hypothetical protein